MEKKGQIVSKERVREHGEVFTAEREVKAMVDLVNDMATKVDCGEGTFLEPACGDGNFLIEILRRKCAALKANKKPNAKDAERYAFRLAWALSSLYGIDILPDNVDKDKISAKVNDGVLEIKLPKFTKEEESRAQRAIEIK